MRADARLVELVGDHGEAHPLVEAGRGRAGVAPHQVAAAGGLDALLSITQMPPGVPVACVGVDSAKNAAVLAARILDA